MAPTTVHEWRHRLSGVLSKDETDLSFISHDSAATYERYRFNRIHGLEQTPEMRKAELKEILERVDSDRQKKVELDELFARLDAENSQMSQNTTAEEDTKLECLEELLTHRGLMEADVVINQDYLHEWLGITGGGDKEDQGSFERGESGSGNAGTESVGGAGEGVEDTEEGIEDTKGGVN